MIDVDELVTVARADEDGYEIALRRRIRADGSGVDELIVDGAFAMDSQSVASEEALADAAGPNPGRVLVGGLGLGFTARRLLERGATQVCVVELSASLIEWAGQGLVHPAAEVLADPRVRVVNADLADVLRQGLGGAAEPWDAVLLDIDNGPDFLIHEKNAGVYGADGIGAALALLAEGGRLAIWSQGPSPELLATLRRQDPDAEERLVEVVREGRATCYAVYTLTR